jgi:hypothetical protein
MTGDREMSGPVRVVVVGGGRTGHAFCALLKGRAGAHVTWFTNKARQIAASMPAEGIAAYSLNNGLVEYGAPDVVTDDPAIAMADAQLVLLAIPAHARPPVLGKLADAIGEREIAFCASPGTGAFDCLAESILPKSDNIVVLGLRNVPYNAYNEVVGRSVEVGSPRAVLKVAVSKYHGTSGVGRALQTLQQLFSPASIVGLEDFLEITLAPGNPIVHGAGLYGLIGPYSQWDGRPFPEAFGWWANLSELSAYFIQRADEELAALRRAVASRRGLQFGRTTRLHDDIVSSFGSNITDPRTLLTTFRTNRAYAGRIPFKYDGGVGGYVLNLESRPIQEDVSYGLEIYLEAGRRLSVDLPLITEIYRWLTSVVGAPALHPFPYLPAHWPLAGPERA